MSLQILLKKSTCKPGELLKWDVVWEFDSTPSKLTIEISWQTSGKGTDDAEAVFYEDWSTDSATGKRSFEYLLPRGPISVRGNLVSIDWSLECTSQRPDDSDTRPFVLSLLDRPVQLSQLLD